MAVCVLVWPWWFLQRIHRLMRYRPVNLIGGFNADDSVPWSVADTVNWIPEAAAGEGTRTPTKFRGAPGLRPFANLGNAPVRGAHNVEGQLFVVAGNNLYSVSLTGVGTVLGTIPGTSRVNMANNQVTGGYQLIIVNGSQNGYVYDTSNSSFQQIFDEGYPGAGSVDYIDSYLIQVEPFGRFIFWSDLATAFDYNTLDRAESESSPDLIVGLAVNQFEVVVFNKRTVDFFYNSGDITGTFKSKRISIYRGCAARDSIVKIDNSLIWLGDDGILYRLNGYQAQPISTPQFSEAIKGKDWSRAFAFNYESDGHKIYYITFPDGKTFGYDVTTAQMHRRKSQGLDRWRLNTLTFWNKQWVGGDCQNGKLYTLDWNYYLEGDCTPLVAERTTGVLSMNQSRVTIPHAEILVDSGGEMTAESVPTISGDLPDGIPGDVVSYQYTINLAYPGQVFTLKLDGALPTGLSIDANGLVTGTVTGSGTFSWTITLLTECGPGVPLADSATFQLYLTSTPYPIESIESMASSGGIQSALFLTPPLDNFQSGANLVSGDLRAVLQTYTSPPENIQSNGTLLSGTIQTILKTYTIPEESMQSNGTLLSGTIQTILITYSNYPPESIQSGGTLVSGSLT